jgi:hypothetical protein
MPTTRDFSQPSLAGFLVWAKSGLFISSGTEAQIIRKWQSKDELD